ncbi:RNA polymerase sigma factor [Dyadobacter endophyticus]|uniref:RNA polymerase sigma factor n=1 Tax=Dyadobacter endophyticus TaxID=1749036 RepID=UPI003CF5F121
MHLNLAAQPFPDCSDDNFKGYFNRMSEQEKELWKAFQGGSKDAFEEILRIFYRPMFDYGFRFQRDHDQLSDDIHDLFLSLWDRRAFLTPTANLKLYLFSALRNQIWRAKKRLSLTQELPDEEDESPFEETDDAETRIIRVEVTEQQLSRIDFVMLKLTKRQQEILHLRFFENLSNSQIAEVLNISEPAVYNLLSLSLKLFRNYWKTCFNALLFLLLICKFFNIN